GEAGGGDAAGAGPGAGPGAGGAAACGTMMTAPELSRRATKPLPRSRRSSASCEDMVPLAPAVRASRSWSARYTSWVPDCLASASSAVARLPAGMSTGAATGAWAWAASAAEHASDSNRRRKGRSGFMAGLPLRRACAALDIRTNQPRKSPHAGPCSLAVEHDRVVEVLGADREPLFDQ